MTQCEVTRTHIRRTTLGETQDVRRVPGWNTMRLGSPTSRWQKQTNTSELKEHKPLNITCLCNCGEGTKALGGEWERVRRLLCLQSPGSWLVGPGSPNGQRFWGLWVSGLFEKDLWSRIKVIYLRTEDHAGFWYLKQGRGEIQRARGGEWGETEEGSRGERGEEELCVMSVFPCLSYFEMWLNGPPSVRQVPGLRAARSPPREPETDRNCKCPACLNIWIICTLINLFKKCKTKWLAWT